MTTRQFLYEDDTTSTPPDVTGLPDGFALFTNDGHLHVVRSGAWVDITPSGGGGSGSGDGNLIGTNDGYTTTSPPPGSLGSDGDFLLDSTTKFLWGPKASGSWTALGYTNLSTSNTHFGLGAPSSSLGAYGDYYIDVTTPTALVLYGPKTTVWPSSGVPAGSSPYASASNETASRNLTSADSGTILESAGSSPITFTIPTGLAADSIIQIDQTGTGVVTITAATGVTINGVAGASHAISAQWGSVILRQVVAGGDNYILIGAFS